ncbi:lysosome-associated membrane glycoprotein 1 [Octodon degus]|uniref:Lysosome-associated membrane glycoprotein 1 n=1 Tax=Octodon degus TaxID=10160 RepID=A0A6P6EF61_OCTDE|nr:lysosome-associated membrane glycoprotein 1 [Octodon degus]
MANFSAVFWTSYATEHGFTNVTFDLPHSARVLNSSFCQKGNASESRLIIAFGDGNSLTLQFTRNTTRYRVQLLSFVYNLTDTHIFPNSSSREVKTENSTTDILADLDKKYRCVSTTQVHMKNVTIRLSDTTIQAYLSNSTFSKEETRCKQDMTSPTSAPPAPSTPPAPPSPSPSPVPPSPSMHRYNVSGSNGTCLLASMGLQLNITYPRKDNTTMARVVNVNPRTVSPKGSCGAQLVSLELSEKTPELSMVLVLRFGLNASANRFFLQEVDLNMTVSDAREASFHAANSSLRALQATLGNSYKCSAEEQLRVTPTFFLNLFGVQVQAFKVEGDKFGSEECLLDGNNMLIPIAVGGALAGLVLIVLIAYLIGRKRSHAGYQTI